MTNEITRKEFLQTLSGAAAASAFIHAGPAGAQTRKCLIKRGVSFYSYQEELYARTMTLEDCFAEVVSMGADGVQLIGEESVPNYPNPPESWVVQWKGLMQKYNTKPTMLNTFVDANIHGENRLQTVKESVDMLVAQIKLSDRLGFKVMRPTIPRTANGPEIIAAALPNAEKYDVKLAPEIHAPTPLKGEWVDKYLELITKTKTKHLGYTLDMGVFAKRQARVARDRMIRDGVVKEDAAKRIDKMYEDGMPREKAAAELERLGAGPGDKQYLARVYGNTMQNPRDLLRIMPYIYNIHGKFYEMTEELREYSLAYEEAIPVLIEGGYAGYIDSEYEGQRHTQDAFETDSCEQVRRHHVMLRRLFGEI
jgi:hypothetical protein